MDYREARFWGRFEEGPPPDHRPDLGPCLLWTGSRNPRNHYGQVYDWELGRTSTIHRVAYRLVHGPIPEGLQVDHLCHVRLCGRPHHLEAVTGAVNIQRGHEARGVSAVIRCRCGATISRRNRECRACYLAGV